MEYSVLTLVIKIDINKLITKNLLKTTDETQ